MITDFLRDFGKGSTEPAPSDATANNNKKAATPANPELDFGESDRVPDGAPWPPTSDDEFTVSSFTF